MVLREEYRWKTGRSCEVMIAGVTVLKDTEVEKYALWLENRAAQSAPAQATADTGAMVPCPHHRENEICYWVRPNRFEQRTCAEKPCSPRHQ